VSCAEDCTDPHGCGGSEQYFWYDAEGRAVKARREALVVAWYASRGRFAEEQTGFDEAQAASARSTRNRWMVGDQPGPATVWLVIRDSRPFLAVAVLHGRPLDENFAIISRTCICDLTHLHLIEYSLSAR
jgi:hypothetical protein